MGDAVHPDRPPGRDAWAADGFAPVPGDTLILPGEERATVTTVYLCAEQIGEVTTRWSWILLADGRLLETAPRGCALYAPPDLLARHSGPYLDLVAQDGALVRFEERVRAGTWEARPVRLRLQGRRWRITATGTVTAHRLGAVPEGSWGQLTGPHAAPAQAGTPDESNVYFTLAAVDDPEALGLGLWAVDVTLAFGRQLGASPAAAGLAIVPEGSGEANSASGA